MLALRIIFSLIIVLCVQESHQGFNIPTKCYFGQGFIYENFTPRRASEAETKQILEWLDEMEQWKVVVNTYGTRQKGMDTKPEAPEPPCLCNPIYCEANQKPTLLHD